MPATERELRARSFGSVVAEYQRGRPSYPRAAIDWLLGDQPLDVLDLGAGTGKLTDGTALRAGHRVTAVEPLEQMRELLITRLPHVRTLEGSRRVTCRCQDSERGRRRRSGAAFHWFEHAVRRSQRSCRVLRAPGGVLGLLGNAFDTSVPWVAERARRSSGDSAIERPWPLALGRQIAGQIAPRGSRIAAFPHAQRRSTCGRLRDLASWRGSLAGRSRTPRRGS